MNELRIFQNNDFGEMRTISHNGQPYICLSDLCKILDIKNTSDCKARLNSSGVVITEGVDTLGRKNEMTFINESNLYKVIFQSRKPEAEKFTEWITSEVLPSIRQTGGYIAGEENMAEDELIQKAMLVLSAKVERLKNKNKQLEENNKNMLPKAQYFDELVNRNLLTSFRDTAKELQIKEKTFIKFLIDNNYIYKDRKNKLQPYSNKNKGLFEVKECKSNINNWVGTQTLVTPKGRETFRLLCTNLRKCKKDLIS